MAYPIQNSPAAMARAAVEGFNTLKREVATLNSKVHADITGKAPSGGIDWQTPTQTADIASSASATTLGTAITRAVELRGVYLRHRQDTLAHKVADATNVMSAATPTDAGTLVTYVNDLRTQYEAHRVATANHYTADSTNTLGSACTDLTTALVLINDEFTKLNAHVQASLTTPSIQIL